MGQNAHIRTNGEREGTPELESDMEVLDAFTHDHSQRILVAASREPMSAQELAEDCETSLPTVYRCVNELVEEGFLETQMQPKDDGNHYRTFETNVERIRIVIEDGTVYTDVKQHEDLVDRFGNLWQDLKFGLSE